MRRFRRVVVAQFIAVLLIVSSHIAMAQPALDQATWLADMKAALSNKEIIAMIERAEQSIQSGTADKRRIAIIESILKNTHENFVHKLHGAEGNMVFVHKDGHEEYVFDGAKQLVKDGMNDGSYNHFAVKDEPLKHFTFDMNPWIMWGNSKGDPSAVKERVRAYVEDVEGGIHRSFEHKETIKEADLSTMDEGDRRALAMFMVAIENGGAGAIYDFYAPSKKDLTKDDIVSALTKLNEGFLKVYQ